jgi:hypothetical protein
MKMVLDDIVTWSVTFRVPEGAGVTACDAGKTSVPKREEVQAAEGDCTVSSSMVHSPH